MISAKRVAWGLLAAAAVGVALGVFKGNETGLRGGIGNLSAPWLLIAMIPALRCRTLSQGAAVGLLSTLIALLGFYAALTVVLAGHLGGGGFSAELAVEAEANRIYFVAGLLTGPILGAAGAWIGRHHPQSVWPIVGALLTSEIAVVALVQGHQLAPAPLYFEWGVDDWTPYIGEAVLGVGIIVAAMWHRHRLASDV
ncbi:MAG TPA: hypothetical protein VFR22_04375 [Nocardioidaceae bacterium]|nr:hypothetical protein [Nocardioidaceae bacterium]